MARGGARPGAGRRKGGKNARTVEREQHMQQATQLIEQALGDTAFAGDAHDLLMAVYKDTSNTLQIRVDAAKAAIGYEKPRLGTTTLRETRTRRCAWSAHWYGRPNSALPDEARQAEREAGRA